MLKILARLLPVGFIDWYEPWLLKKDERILDLIRNLDQNTIQTIVEKKLLRVLNQAAKYVPAYMDFVASNNVDVNKVNSLDTFNSLVPATTKNNYIDKYPLEERCINGKLPRY